MAEKKSPRAALFLEKVFEDMEAAYPYYRLLEAGFQVDLISPEVPGTTFYGKYGYPLTSTHHIKKVKAKDYAVLIIPGGWAPDRLRRYKEILDFTRAMHHDRKIIASICHGPWVLASAGIIKGKQITSVGAIKDDLVNAGAKWVNQEVVVDSKIVTSRTPADLPAFMKMIVKLFESERF